MSRLTKRAENGTAVYATPSGEPVKWENNRHKVLQKLADYEDLEEQGLLLKLPCKVGDTIYLVKGKNHVEIEELEVMKFLYSNELDIMFSDEIYEVGLTSIKEIGKSVFITEEEAEKALERLEKENE